MNKEQNAESKLEQAAKAYNSPYPPEVTYKSDKNFIVRLKAFVDKMMNKHGYKAYGDKFVNFISEFENAEDYFFESKSLTTHASKPSIDEAGVIAVRVSENIKPELTAKEQALFIAGFQECVKYLGESTPSKPHTVEEEAKPLKVIEQDDTTPMDNILSVEEGQTQEPVGGMSEKEGWVIRYEFLRRTKNMQDAIFQLVDEIKLVNCPPPAPIKKIVNEDMICPETNKHCDDECCTVGSECNISGENIQYNYDAPIKTEGEDEIKQEFKELRTYIEDLYHGAGVNMQIWIELSDKMNAFERKVLAGYSASLPQSSTEEERDLWGEVIREVEHNEFLATKYKEVLDRLQSTYKISKR